jgi:hypothetical protein
MTDPLPELAYLHGGEKEEVYSKSWGNILSCHGVLWGGMNGETSSMYYPVASRGHYLRTAFRGS